MTRDVLGIERVVAGYARVPNAKGRQPCEVEYKLKPVELAFLQTIFKINPHDPDPANRDLIHCYRINLEQAKALQPYVLDGQIDIDKYDFMLECYQA